MGRLKIRIEQGFEDFTALIFRFRWPVVLLMLLLAFGALRQLPNLTIDMSDEGFLHPQDEILLSYNEFRDQFGRDDLIVMAIESDQVFSQPFLKKLKKLHALLEEKVPHLNDITSLVNARNTRGVKDGIVVEDLLEKWPQDEAALTALKKRVLANPLYRDRLISADGRFTTLVIEADAYAAPPINEAELLAGFDDLEENLSPDPAEPEGGQNQPRYLNDKERGKIVMTVKKIAAQFQADNFQINLAGSPVVTHTVKKTMRTDMMLFIRLAVLVIAISLFFMFRRLSAVAYPLFVVGLALISTLALMALLGVAIKLPTMILPSFILAVGVGDSVHVLAIFFQNLKKSGDKQQALVKAMGHSGLAIVMTSLTTAAGLASFFRAEIAPVADLGLFAAFGVLLALIYSIVFLPALLAVTPLKSRQNLGKINENNSDDGVMTRFFDWITDFSTQQSKAIIAASIIIMIISFGGISRLSFSHDILSWLPDTMPVKNATASIDHNLNGSVTLELVLDTGHENGLYEPEMLNKIDRFSRELASAESSTVRVGKVMSVVDILKEIHQALNENRPEYYKIPQNPRLIPQEFLLFENSGSDDLEDVVDSRFQLARITIKVPWQDAMHYVPFIEKIEKKGREIFDPEVSITSTGIMALFGRILYAAIHSAAQSYLIAFIIITLMMVFLVGSLRLGTLCMLPNLAPIIITLGFMGWAGLEFNMFTMLIGSIAIGLAVDDTVHFVYNFRRYFIQAEEPVTAVRQTLQTTGRAMLTTTVVLTLGFFIFMFASMENLFNFGLLTGITLILALVADFFLAPALMTVLAQSRAGRTAISAR